MHARESKIQPRFLLCGLMVVLVGPLAMIGCEPRQTRKGAAAAADSCAGVWLAGVATLFLL